MHGQRRHKLGWLDILVIVGVLSVVVYLTYRVVGVLHYKWNWVEIPQ